MVLSGPLRRKFRSSFRKHVAAIYKTSLVFKILLPYGPILKKRKKMWKKNGKYFKKQSSKCIAQGKYQPKISNNCDTDNWTPLTLQCSRLYLGLFGYTFPKIRFSKCCFFCTYDAFSTKLFMGGYCDSAHKSCFMEFRNLKLDKKGVKNLWKYHCGPMGKWNILSILESANNSERDWNWNSGGPVEHTRTCGTFDLLVFNVFVVLRSFSNLASNAL